MTTVKGLTIAALLLGGTSLAIAQTPPTAGPKQSAGVTTGPTGAPAYIPNRTAQTGHATHHKKMHLSAKSPQHKKMYMQANTPAKPEAKSTHKHKNAKAAPAASDTKKQ